MYDAWFDEVDEFVNRDADDVLNRVHNTFKTFIKYVYTVPGFSPSIYQRKIIKPVAISCLEIFAGRSVWERHKYKILDFYCIETKHNATFSTTIRRFGKSIIAGILASSLALSTCGPQYPGEWLYLPIFAQTEKSSIRLLETVRKFILLLIEKYEINHFTCTFNKTNIRLHHKNDRFWVVELTANCCSKVCIVLLGKFIWFFVVISI
jgi:hypothetical protein